jgi:hypothetical protein
VNIATVIRLVNPRMICLTRRELVSFSFPQAAALDRNYRGTGGVNVTGWVAGQRFHGDGIRLMFSTPMASRMSGSKCSTVSTAPLAMIRAGACAGQACGPADHER